MPRVKPCFCASPLSTSAYGGLCSRDKRHYLTQDGIMLEAVCLLGYPSHGLPPLLSGEGSANMALLLDD